MSKLYFKYGTMNSSKSAQCLMTKHNYETKGMKVLLLKPSLDNRDGKFTIKSRIGISAEAELIGPTQNLLQYINDNHASKHPNKSCQLYDFDVILVDECQFLNKEQVQNLRQFVNKTEIPVMCFGLLTNFKTELFEGSKRLIELSDSIAEIKSICRCGRKAIINARIDKNGHIIKEGPELLIGSEDYYDNLCHQCYTESCLY